MEIRKMTEKDLKEVMDIELRIYKDPWNLKAYTEELTNKYANNYVLTDNDKIIGYYGLWIVDDYATITKVSIDTIYQGKHYSILLMDHMEKILTEHDVCSIDLEVRESNIKAISLYEKYYFIKMGIRKKYYSNGENAILMIRKMKDGEGYEKICISA